MLRPLTVSLGMVLVVAVVAHERHVGRFALLAAGAAVLVVIAGELVPSLLGLDTGPTQTFVAEEPPDRPAVATHDLNELVTALTATRHGVLPSDVADRVRSIATRRLGTVDGGDQPPVSSCLAAVLAGADLRAAELDAVLGELEAL